MMVGDRYRLEHIKLMLEQKKTLYDSDRAYIDHLIHEYIKEIKTQKELAKIRGETPFKEKLRDVEDKDELVELHYISCWKCKKSLPANSKFCLDCGSGIKKHEVKKGSTEEVSEKITENKSGEGTKKNIFIVIGVLAILVVIGGAVVMSGGFEKTISSTVDDSAQPSKEVTSGTTMSDLDTNSKCGAGTVFDDTTSTCILEGTVTASKCGAGTVFDEELNMCMLKGISTITITEPKVTVPKVKSFSQMSDFELNQIKMDWQYRDLLRNIDDYSEKIIFVDGVVNNYAEFDAYIVQRDVDSINLCINMGPYICDEFMFVRVNGIDTWLEDDRLSGYVKVRDLGEVFHDNRMTGEKMVPSGDYVPQVIEIKLTCSNC